MSEQINPKELLDLKDKVDTLIRRERIDFFNGDKREIFERLVGVESNLKSLSLSIDKFFEKIPCKDHADKINKTELKIEKTKFSLIMALISIIISLGSIVGVTMAFLKMAM